jgi:hypothetical protein
VKATNPVTAEQAVIFDGYVAKWQPRLNLADWRIVRGTRPAKGAMADVSFDESARLATYRLGDFGAEAITPDSLERTAIHELGHVMLHDLIATAQDRGATPEQLEAAEHKIINLLEGLLFERRGL